VDNKTPEKLFQKKWAQTILEGAVSRLREEYTAAGKEDAYAVLQAFEPGEQKSLSYFEAASRLNVNETAFKSMVHRLRKRHRELVREVIAETVSSASEIDEELRYLIRIVGE
jgi:RNA polymerase sigma-70 factor (ECF subfamily)